MFRGYYKHDSKWNELMVHSAEQYINSRIAQGTIKRVLYDHEKRRIEWEDYLEAVKNKSK